MKNIFWGSNERRLRALWRILLHAIVMAVFTVLASAGGAWLIALQTGRPMDVLLAGGGNPALLADIPFGAAIFGVATLIAFMTSIWLAGRFFDRRYFADFGVRFNRAWWRDLGFGLALGVLLMTLIFLIEWAAGWITITGAFQTTMPNTSFGVAVLNPLILFLCVGIYEEFMSRGYHLKNLAEGFSFLGARRAILIATVLSSAIFGVLHAGNPNATAISTTNIVVAGIFLALGYILTRELAIPIGLHITWNFFQGNVFGFPVSGQDAGTTVLAIAQGGNPLITGGAFGPEAGLIGIGAMALGMVLIIYWVQRHTGDTRFRIAIATPELRHSATQIAAEGEPDVEMDSTHSV